MKGLAIWAFHPCRSVMEWFRGLGAAFEVPLRVFCAKGMQSHRAQAGWSIEEFSGIDWQSFDMNLERAAALMHETADWHHLCTGYQNHAILRSVIKTLQLKGCNPGLFLESPLNEEAPPKRYLKEVYLRTLVPLKVASLVKNAPFVINLSGDSFNAMKGIGWADEKIIPCGYYPPPLPNIPFIQRKATPRAVPNLLMTGIPAWRRGPDVFIEALGHLRRRNVSFCATVTGSGSLIAPLQKQAARLGIAENVHFPGFVSPEQLAYLHKQADIYVAAGRYEPWGIRVNDALNSGLPCIVSDGMGAVKMIHETGAGLTFRSEDALDLSWKLQSLAQDEALGTRIQGTLPFAAAYISPSSAANRIASCIKKTTWYR